MTGDTTTRRQNGVSKQHPSDEFGKSAIVAELEGKAEVVST